jgi:hypothetical protein
MYSVVSIIFMAIDQLTTKCGRVGGGGGGGAHNLTSEWSVGLSPDGPREGNFLTDPRIRQVHSNCRFQLHNFYVRKTFRFTQK